MQNRSLEKATKNRGRPFFERGARELRGSLTTSTPWTHLRSPWAYPALRVGCWQKRRREGVSARWGRCRFLFFYRQSMPFAGFQIIGPWQSTFLLFFYLLSHFHYCWRASAVGQLLLS